MRKFFLTTYLMNSTQVASMAALSLGVPYLIGLEEYGRYAVAFAMPGLIHGFFESALITVAMRNRDKGLVPLRHFRDLTFVHVISGIISALLITSSMHALNTSYDIGIAIAIFLALYCRVIANAILYDRFKIELIRNLTMRNDIFQIFSIPILYLFTKTYLLPSLIIIFSGFFFAAQAIAYTVRCASYHDPDRKTAEVKTWRFMRLLLSIGTIRIYEDGQFTLMPALLYPIFGNTISGQYRLATSVCKIVNKLFPIRYEVLQVALSEKAISRRRLINLLSAFMALGVPLFFVLSAAEWLGYLSHFGWPRFIVISAGAIAIASIGLPVLTFLGLVRTAASIGILVFTVDVAGLLTGTFIWAFSISNAIAAMFVIILLNKALKDREDATGCSVPASR